MIRLEPLFQRTIQRSLTNLPAQHCPMHPRTRLRGFPRVAATVPRNKAAALQPLPAVPQPPGLGERRSPSCPAMPSLSCARPAAGLGCWNCRMLELQDAALPPPPCSPAQTLPDASGCPALKASFLPSFEARGAIPQKKALLPSKGFCSRAVARPESAAFTRLGLLLSACNWAKHRARARHKPPAPRKILAAE